MASVLLDTIKTLGQNKHNVGSLNEWTKNVVNQGAKVSGGAIDNYQLVELGFDAEGERICTALSANNKMGFLIASVEEYMEEYGETISNFYNAVGERARIVRLPLGERFEASNFEKADVSKDVKNGQKVHYDATKKKYIISNGTATHTDYATAANTFVVVGVGNSIDGQPLVKLEAIVQ